MKQKKILNLNKSNIINIGLFAGYIANSLNQNGEKVFIKDRNYFTWIYYNKQDSKIYLLKIERSFLVKKPWFAGLLSLLTMVTGAVLVATLFFNPLAAAVGIISLIMASTLASLAGYLFYRKFKPTNENIVDTIKKKIIGGEAQGVEIAVEELEVQTGEMLKKTIEILKKENITIETNALTEFLKSLKSEDLAKLVSEIKALEIEKSLESCQAWKEAQEKLNKMKDTEVEKKKTTIQDQKSSLGQELGATQSGKISSEQSIIQPS